MLCKLSKYFARAYLSTFIPILLVVQLHDGIAHTDYAVIVTLPTQIDSLIRPFDPYAALLPNLPQLLVHELTVLTIYMQLFLNLYII